MSVFRTAYPTDSFTANTPDGPVTIVYGGTAVPDAHDQTVRDQAAAAHVLLLEGGIVVPPSTSPLQTQVSVLAGQVAQMPVPLVEQTQLVVGPAWPLARSGQTVPVSMDGATSAKTLTLETGGTGSRCAIRLDVAAAGGWALQLAGSGSDVVPVVQLVTAGSVAFLEGIAGGGGWRLVQLYEPNRPVAWTQITGKPTIPTTFSQLTGYVDDLNIPGTITRDTELTAGLSGKSDTGHTHAYVATSSVGQSGGVAAFSHTHAAASVPVCESRLTADFSATAFDGNTYYGMRTQMAPPSGMDPFGMWSLQAGATGRYIMTVPTGWGGRYAIDWTIYSTGVSTSLLANVLLNCPAATADTGIAGTIALREGGFGVPTTCSGSLLLSAGDTISFAMYAQQNGTVKWGAIASLAGTIARTKAVMRYVGPA